MPKPEPALSSLLVCQLNADAPLRTTAGIGAIAENPKRLGAVIILVALPETVAILGFVIAYLIIDKA